MPQWPLSTATKRERTVWNRLWRKPQALLWEKNGQHDLVALYVRRFIEAEERGASTSLSTLVRQMADALLLTIPAMRSQRVRIADDEVSAARAAKAEPKRARESDAGDSVRDRLKAVQGGGA